MNIRFIIACLAAAAGVQQAAGGTVTPYTNASGLACVTGPDPLVFNRCVYGTDINTTLPAGTGTMTMSANSQSGYGVLRASTALSFTGSNTRAYGLASNFANFLDIITIGFPSGTGSEGNLLLGFTLDGTNTASSGYLAQARVLAVIDPGLSGNGQSYELYFTEPAVSGMFFFPTTFTFVYGQPFSLTFQLTDQCTNAGFGPGNQGTAPGICVSDFSNTLILSALDVVDSQGNPINGVTFSSESGTQYSANGVVPEPSTFGLLATALVSLGAIRCKMRRRKI